MLRFFLCRPEGAATKQPRATPWENRLAARPLPCKGKTISPHPNDASVEPASVRNLNSTTVPRLLRPFRARNYRIPALSPRALPWADMLSPFGARLKRRNVKTCASGWRPGRLGGWSIETLARASS